MTLISRVTAIHSKGSDRTVGLRYTLESGEEVEYFLKDDPAFDQELARWSVGMVPGVEWDAFEYDGYEPPIDSAPEQFPAPELMPDEEHALTPKLESKHEYWPEVRKYILGGNALFTVVFGELVGRRTFRVKSGKKDRNSNWSTGNQDRSIYWVSLKIAPGNGFDDFITIGRLQQDINGEYLFQPKLDSNGRGHFAGVLFQSLWKPLENGARVHPGYEFYHASSCCVCGRTLTVPSSIQSGIGPECEGKM